MVSAAKLQYLQEVLGIQEWIRPKSLAPSTSGSWTFTKQSDPQLIVVADHHQAQEYTTTLKKMIGATKIPRVQICSVTQAAPALMGELVQASAPTVVVLGLDLGRDLINEDQVGLYERDNKTFCLTHSLMEMHGPNGPSAKKAVWNQLKQVMELVNV